MPNSCFDTLSAPLLHGEIVLYWPTGGMKRQCFFEQGKRIGWDRMWSEEGVLVDEGLYDRGVPIGIHSRWTSLGELIEQYEYV